MTEEEAVANFKLAYKQFNEACFELGVHNITVELIAARTERAAAGTMRGYNTPRLVSDVKYNHFAFSVKKEFRL